MTATAQNATTQDVSSNHLIQTGGSLQPTESTPIVAGDIVSIHVYDDQELDQSHLRVTDSGAVPILLLDPVKVAGLTPGEAGAAIAQAYMAKKILLNAHIQVSVETISSSDVTVIGYVNGITGQTTGAAFPLPAPRPLLTVLAMAGGLSDRASRTVTIQRRVPQGARITVTLPVDANKDLDNDPTVFPGDIVVVPRAGLVYILGNVSHPQAVVMNEDGKITLMEALSQAGSPLPTASLRKVMLFRKGELAYKSQGINLGKILKGIDQDIALAPEDVIWVPFSFGKNILVNSAQIAAAVGSATASGIIYTH